MTQEHINKALRQVHLEDKYTLDKGQIFLTGLQALVRLPLMQRRLDQQNGLNTAGFISGYRGSPLGGYDLALWRAQKHLDAHQIHFRPGVNEDLGATAVWGSQQVNLSPMQLFKGFLAFGMGKDRVLTEQGMSFGMLMLLEAVSMVAFSPSRGMTMLASHRPYPTRLNMLLWTL